MACLPCSILLVGVLGVLGVLGCSSVERGRVDVIAFSDQGPTAEGPLFGALVVFADRDGTSRTAYIDEEGHAAGDVEEGGSVWLLKPAPSFGWTLYVAYADVQPGSTLRFGPPAPPARTKRATMAIAGTTLPQPVDFVRIYSSCGKALPDGRLELDDRCSSTADVLAVAWEQINPNNRIVSYAHLPAQPIVDGGTITFGPGDWRVPEQISIQLRNATGMRVQGFLESSYGVRSTDVRTQGDMITATMPAIGSLRLFMRVERDLLQPGQAIHVVLPPVTSHEVDLDQVASPWVLRDQGQPRAWSTDDLGGALVAQTMVTEYLWNQPIANYEEWMHVRIISAPALGGDVGVPRLPDELSSQQPGEDFQIESRVHLIRIEGGEPSDAAWFTERISRNVGISLLEELPVTSYATTAEL